MKDWITFVFVFIGLFILSIGRKINAEYVDDTILRVAWEIKLRNEDGYQ